MKKLLLLLTFLIVFFGSLKATTDTLQIYSNSMFKNVKCVVVTPWNYTSTATRYPVVYLLHGYSGNYADWVTKVSGMQKLADDNNFIIVCPDGAFSSWYFDSPVDLNMRYETNVAVEIPTFIDANYRTIASRNGRAITGLSMGGHGGLFLGMRHAKFFGACGSMSGALDISRLRGYGIDKILGDTIANAKYFIDWAVINAVDAYPTDTLAMIIDCGTEDFLIEANRRTHQKLLQRNIPHDYVERPGGHTWEYWANAVTYQFHFFKQYFSRNNK